MITDTHEGSITTNGLATKAFNIEINEHMFKLLTSKVYQDPILAVMREWSTNAIDACKAGKLPISVEVHLPTVDETYFSVRDYGIGLSKDEILGLFCTLGASTKRASNDFNGSFGIGRMAGLAYSSSFMVEAWKDGQYENIAITVDKGTPTAVELVSSATTEPNGLKLTVQVEPKDIKYFVEKAATLYKYFEVPPTTNIPISFNKNTVLEISDNWVIDSSLGRWDNYILMSDVLYIIPRVSSIDCKGFGGLLIKAPTGSVSINPGRESLSLDNQTIEFVNKAFSDAEKDYADFAYDIVSTLPTPVEQIEKLAILLNTVPNGVRKATSNRCIPLICNYITLTNYASPKLYFSSPGIEFKAKVNYYKTLRAYTELSMTSLTQTTVLIIDTTTWRHCLDTFNDNTLVLNRVNTGMDTFIKNATAWCAMMGFTKVVKTSEYATSSITKEKQIREGIHVSSMWLNGSFSASVKCDPNKTYHYVNLSGTTLDEEIDLTALLTALSMYNKNKQQSDQIQLFGVPKKYKHLAEQNDKFIHVIGVLNNALENEIFYEHCNDMNNPIRKGYDIDLPDNTPEDVSTYFKEVDDYAKHYNTNSNKYVVNGTKSMFEGHIKNNIQLYTPTYKAQDLLHKYKCLDSLLRVSSTEQLQHYFKLEEAYSNDILQIE